MANPTSTYGWAFPAENEDPWYSTFAAAWQSADTTVASVEQLARTLKTTLVVSCYNTVSVLWPASTTLPNAANSTVCSAAPYGRFAGTVTVPFSGSNVAFDLQVNIGPNHTVVGTVADIIQAFRLVTAASVNVTGDSAWIFRHQIANAVVPLQFTAVVSLGAGTHTVELQQRAQSTAGQSSETKIWGGTARVLLWARVEPR